MIGVAGLWHLGSVISVSWASLGLGVVGFDYDRRLVSELNAGRPPLFETGLAETLNDNLRAGRLSFSEDINSLAGCEFIFLAFDTPVDVDDLSDTEVLERAAADIAPVMRDGAILVVSSQSPVGFSGLLRLRIKKENPSCELAYSPENLRLGEAINNYRNPGRIILGTADPEAEKRCVELFKHISDQIVGMSIESAEMVKHGINSFLATSIVFADNLADMCERHNARIDDVVRGMKSDARIGPKAYLSPGIGFSGGTLGRDLAVLGRSNGSDKPENFFRTIGDLNAGRRRVIVNKAKNLLGDLRGKSIGVLGLTYKSGTSTLRRSLPLEIVGLLLEEQAVVKVFDPRADYSELKKPPGFITVDSIEEAAAGVDLLLLLTDWDLFKQYNWAPVASRMRGRAFYDTRNCLDEIEMRKRGFAYFSIGRS